MQEETDKSKKITHRLAVQLAQYRLKEKQSEALSEPLLENKPEVIDGSDVAPEEIIQTVPHIHTSLDTGFGEKGDIYFLFLCLSIDINFN